VYLVTLSTFSAQRELLGGRFRAALHQNKESIYVDDALTPQQLRMRADQKPHAQQLRKEGKRYRWREAHLQVWQARSGGGGSWITVQPLPPPPPSPAGAGGSGQQQQQQQQQQRQQAATGQRGTSTTGAGG
jgi:hypothetical protein